MQYSKEKQVRTKEHKALERNKRKAEKQRDLERQKQREQKRG